MERPLELARNRRRSLAEHRHAVAALLPGQFARVGRPPYEVLATLVGNGLLATALWFLAPPGLQALFFSFRTEFLFPVVLATWMLADVPSTNQLGSDAAEALKRLEHPEAMTDLLRAKQVVLWMLVTPVATLAAVVLGIMSGTWLSLIATMAWIATVPMAGLGLSCLVGVRWPYHPITLRQRWAQRRDQRNDARWLSLILLPYVLVPAVGALALLPPAIVYVALHGFEAVDQVGRVDDLPLVLGTLVSVPLSLGLWRWGTTRAGHVAYARRAELTAYLKDPSRG